MANNSGNVPKITTIVSNEKHFIVSKLLKLDMDATRNITGLNQHGKCVYHTKSNKIGAVCEILCAYLMKYI